MNLLINRGKTPEEILKRYLDRKNSRKPPGDNGGDEGGNGDEDPPGDSNFKLEDLTDCYRINGVKYRNEVYRVDLSKELLPSKTQDEHTEHRKQVINNENEVYTPDYPLFHSIITSLEQNKDNQHYKQKVEEVRLFLRQSAIDHWLMTLTRIQYNPDNQKDIVIHNYNQSDKYTKDLDSFIGPDGNITNTTKISKPLKALLDTKQSIQKINQTYKWLTDVDAYIWRINSERENKDERIAGVRVGSIRVILYCGRVLGGRGRAFGVRARKIRG